MEREAAFAPDPELERLKGALERARQAEGTLDLLTRGVVDFAVILLNPEGRMVYWNEGASRIFGYDGTEAIGLSGEVLFLAEDRVARRHAKELQAARESGRAVDENWLRRKDGSRFWASGSTTPIWSPAGELQGYVKVVQDASQKKLLEDELQRLNLALEERVRSRTAELEEALKEMGAFSYSIAHDLRAPLRAMSGFAELLEEESGGRLDATALDYLRRIRDSSTFMNHMIEDLLTYSRLTRADVLCHPLDPAKVIDDVLRQLAPEIEETGAEIEVRRPLPRVLAHEVTLAQVFSNLIGNALKFVKAGTRPRVRIYGEEREGWARIWVDDNGIGVPAEHAKRIFGIFERLHASSAFPGTGIGLAIVNRAMERMKGRVGVEPAPDGGSRFWIDLRPVLKGVEGDTRS